MDNILVAAALASALLHAAWNAAVKASPRPTQAMTGQILCSALLSAPALAWAGLPAPAAWPWMAISTLLAMAAVGALLRGYRHGAFGVVYPVARASSVLLVLPLAAAVASEWPSALATAGVALVSTAVALLALAPGRAQALSRRALGWTLASAALTAGYVVCDSQGVRQAGSAPAYGLALSIVNGATWSLWRWRAARVPPWFEVPWRVAVPSAFAAVASYLLILWVWSRAPVALGAALRDTSALFATLIAVTLLKERLGASALLAVAVASAGCVLIRLG